MQPSRPPASLKKAAGVPVVTEQVVGTMGGTKFGYDMNGRPFLTKVPKLLLNNDNAGKFGTFTPTLDDEARKKGWTVISIKNDWKRIFAFE